MFIIYQIRKFLENRFLQIVIRKKDVVKCYRVLEVVEEYFCVGVIRDIFMKFWYLIWG